MLTLEQVAAIRLEARRRRRDPDLIQNQEMHRRLLATWERDRPRMWASLSAAGRGVADDLAFVAQQRMWERRAELMKAGMPLTDARETAEREHLLLTPEADEAEMARPEEPEAP